MAVMGATLESERERAFTSLVAQFLPDAQRLAYAMLLSSADCEDAVQEATIKAWLAHHRLREGSNFRAWFLTIVANECRQRRRNKWWSILKLPDRLATAAADISEAEIDLRRALVRLPYDSRLALVLRYYLDLPMDEVGRVLGVSEKAAKSRIHRGIRRLRVEVDGDDDA